MMFDPMLHRRVKHLRKILVNDEKESIGVAQKLDNKKEALKTYKDLRLVKVDDEGKKK